MKEKEERRCWRCHKLLGKGTVLDFEIKCPRCGAYNLFRAKSPASEPPDGQKDAEYAYQEKSE